MTERRYLLEDKIRKRWSREKRAYRELGIYITSEIQKRINALGIDGKYLLRMPIIPRLKDSDSLIDKALYRKNYENPYDKITDKVGLRIVVLTDEDIELVETTLKQIGTINFRCTKDFREERKIRPTVFDYQGVHYEANLTERTFLMGRWILDNYICEIQIRTLLQHAISELSHDITYKSEIIPQPYIQRIVSNCMGLVEATSYLFSETSKAVKKEREQLDDLTKVLTQEYGKLYHAPINYDFDLQKRIYHSLRSVLTEENEKGLINELQSFISDSGTHLIVKDAVNKRHSDSLLYRQPIVLLLFYFAHNFPTKLITNWPYLEEQLEPIFTDIGSSMPNLISN